MPNNLPLTFPRNVTIKLSAGLHNGQPQLWSSFEHEGKHYKMVISYASRDGIVCYAGETWSVWPQNSPNGHIVFCRPDHMVLTASGATPQYCRVKEPRWNRVVEDDYDEDEALEKFRETFFGRFCGEEY